MKTSRAHESRRLWTLSGQQRALRKYCRRINARYIAAALATIIVASVSNAAQGQLLAFPGAEGAGQYATGGRGGDVYYVTNLNDSGPGSLRYGVQTANGPRTIEFQTDGTIHLLSDLDINKSNLTIAGQTAPGGGITIADYQTEVVNSHDDVIQYMRFRVGDTNTQHPGNTYEPDSLGIHGSTNVMIDHVTASWSVDEALSVTDSSTNVSVQYSFITQALKNAGHPEGAHSYGSLINGGDITYSHDLYADNDSRNPRAQGNSTVGTGLTLDFVNNVIQNPGGRFGYSGTGDTLKMNYVGNYGIDGPSTSSGNSLFQPDSATTQIYFQGNYRDSNKNGVLDGTPATGTSLVSGTYTASSTPFNDNGNMPLVNASDAREAYIQVLSHAGASYSQDSVDRQIVRNVINQTGAIIDSQTQVGGWPALTAGIPTKDSSNDGIPDWWAQANGLNPAQYDANRIASNGYTYLENYLQSLSPHAYAPAQTHITALTTGFGRGADAIVTENGGTTAVSGGSGLGPSLDAIWSGTSGSSNQVIALKFDLSQIASGSITDATLGLTLASALAGTHQFKIFGLEQDAPGWNWSENTIQFNNAPGLTFDGKSGTLGLNATSTNITSILNLGTLTVGATAAGQTISFNNANLAVFLNLAAHFAGTPEADLITIYIEQTNSSSLASFYSKEGNAQFAPTLTITSADATAAVRIPEPASAMLAVLGALGLLLLQRRRR
jgi:hypothetical protein